MDEDITGFSPDKDEFDRLWYNVIIVDKFKTNYWLSLEKHGLNNVSSLSYIAENYSIIKDMIKMNYIHSKVFEKFLNSYMKQKKFFDKWLSGLKFNKKDPLFNKIDVYKSRIFDKRGITTLESLFYHCPKFSDLVLLLKDKSKIMKTLI